MDPATIGLIASVAGPYLMKLFGGDDQPQGEELEKLLGIQRHRMAQTQPLHDSMLRLAMGLMPTYAQGQLGQAQSSAGPAHFAQPRPSAIARPAGY
jgi:hypothetical protein